MPRRNRTWCLVLLFLPLTLWAQETAPAYWEQYLTELYEDGEEAAVSMEEAYAFLTELTLQPLDINTASEDELLQIPGLTERQARDIDAYRRKYGRMRSTEELAMIPSIDNRLRLYLQAFLAVPQGAEELKWYSREGLRRETKRLDAQVTATASVPLYYRVGDMEKYLGDPVGHSLRLSAGMGSNVRLNVTGGKRAGEPFFGKGNGAGYDAYAYNLSVRNLGVLNRLIVGQYKARFGMGLLMNNGFSTGKQMALTSLGRTAAVFTPHSGVTDALHMEGVAATLGKGPWQLSAFFSYRHVDATLNKDSTVASIPQTTYHRTVGEMAKKNNTALTTAGLHFGYAGRAGRQIDYAIGASVVYAHSDRMFNPVFSTADTVSAAKQYRLFDAKGRDFWNASVDYRLTWDALSFMGETALCECGEVATLNSLSWEASRYVTLTALQRYYSYAYHALYGSSFSEGGEVQNESGLYLGMRWKPTGRLTVDVYSDIAYFPWLRYRVATSSYTWDNSAAMTWELGTWNVAARYRLKWRQREGNSADHWLRLTAARQGGRWELRSQLEACLHSSGGNSGGVMASQAVGWKAAKWLQLYAFAAYFNTKDYDTRLYAYEKGMQYSFGYTAYSGHGMRAALMARADVARWLTVMLKAGHTRYFDRSTIGTADRMINSNSKTDIDIQLRIKI